MKTYSQVGQDIYVMEKLNNKNNGYYIEIGAYDPTNLSNTKLLEENDWSGISFDIVDITQHWYSQRKNKFICADVTNFDFIKCFEENNVPLEIDYLSFDIDEASLTCLKKMPLDKYKFKVITMEHDAYRFGEHVKHEMRGILSFFGYKLDENKSGNNFANQLNFEDWWLL